MLFTELVMAGGAKKGLAKLMLLKVPPVAKPVRKAALAPDA